MEEICSGRRSSGWFTLTLRKVVLLRPASESARERAEPTTAPPSKGMPSRAAKIADFVRNLAEGVLLRFGEVAFAAFAINVDEIDGFVFRNVKINHPRAAALADANRGKAHAGFAESAASAHDIALLRLSSKVELEISIVIIGKTKNGLGELGRFNEHHMTG